MPLRIIHVILICIVLTDITRSTKIYFIDGVSGNLATKNYLVAGFSVHYLRLKAIGRQSRMADITKPKFRVVAFLKQGCGMHVGSYARNSQSRFLFLYYEALIFYCSI